MVSGCPERDVSNCSEKIYDLDERPLALSILSLQQSGGKGVFRDLQSHRARLKLDFPGWPWFPYGVGMEMETAFSPGNIIIGYSKRISSRTTYNPNLLVPNLYKYLRLQLLIAAQLRQPIIVSNIKHLPIKNVQGLPKMYFGAL